MKVLHVVGWYYPDSVGGTEVYVSALCDRLRARGHDVLVAAPEPGAATERRYEHDGVHVYRYPIPRDPTRAECQGSVRARGTELFHAWMRRERPDVVHLHTFTTGLSLHEVTAARAAGARVVVTTHSSSLGFICQRGTMMRWGETLCDGVAAPAKCAACSLEHNGVPRPAAALLGMIPRGVGQRLTAIPGRAGTALGMADVIARNLAMQGDMLALVDRFVVLTGWALDTVARNGAPREKLVLNRLGVSQRTSRQKSGPVDAPTRRPIRVGYLGRYEELKGVLVLARAISLLDREVALTVEFRGPIRSDAERNAVARMQAIVGDDPRVEFAPAVAPSDAPGVLASYDLLCCPSLCLEGGPTVAIEAHAIGTPVIGSRIGGLAELIDDPVNGRLVAPGDARALALLLEELAGDPALVDRWRRALPPARTMDDVTADYEALYEQILSDAAMGDPASSRVPLGSPRWPA